LRFEGVNSLEKEESIINYPISNVWYIRIMFIIFVRVNVIKIMSIYYFYVVGI
jgi:hypothetical protein